MKWYFGRASANGPHYYRQVLPIRHLARHLRSRGVTVKISRRFDHAFDADVCFFSRNIGASNLPLVLALKQMGKTIIWDFDDYLMLPERWVEKDETWVLKEIAAMSCCIDLADFVTVSVPQLGVSLQLDKPWGVLPNKIDGKDWRYWDWNENLTPRILYAGSNTHGRDLELVRRLYKQTKRDYHWTFFGIQPRWADRFAVCIPLTSVRDYPKMVRMIQADYALAPLEPCEFNLCKSPIKVWEMATACFTVVASDFGPYKSHPAAVVPGGEEFTPTHLEDAYRTHNNTLDIARMNTWGSPTAPPCPWKKFFDAIIDGELP